jgi:ribose/xylose/arabinose/galactoside ABC-type transport system permease subunit
VSDRQGVMAQSKLRHPTSGGLISRLFVQVGMLPVLLVVAIVLFGTVEPRFLSLANMTNVIRQATYLVIVSMGQMIVLLTAGLDLSVGSTIALVSVVTATIMAAVLAADPGAVGLAIGIGITAGLATGAVVGVVNGVGVAVLKVTPFMMTLGMLSITFGLALTLSGGSPVYGMPKSFGNILGYSRLLGVPVPVYIAGAIVIFVYGLLNWMRVGRYFYALGSNPRAVHLSGIRVPSYLFLAYTLCGLLAGAAGVLLTARVLSGEANMGQELVLQSIAACVIGGVSLFGGIGRVGNVLLGAIFITLLTNGMNLIRVNGYLQQVVVGVVLIFAIVIDQMRLRRAGQLRAS